MEDVANDPTATKVNQRFGGILLIATRNSVSITVVIDGTGNIKTAFPT